MFLDDNEYILYMDCEQEDRSLVTVDELRQLRQAGIRTAYRHYIRFDDFWVKGVPNWRVFDEYIERVDKAGMKSIQQLWQSETGMAPAAWRAKKAGGIVNALSPWSQEAQEWNRDIIRMVIRRYAGDNVLFVTGQHQVTKGYSGIQPHTLTIMLWRIGRKNMTANRIIKRQRVQNGSRNPM